MGAAALSLRSSHGAEIDSDFVAILNDTHIPANPADDPAHGANLKQAVKHLLELPVRPAAVLVNGDLAWKNGDPGDYRAFAELIRPLRDAGHVIHLTRGNRDMREAFYAVLRDDKPEHPLVLGRQVSVVETPRANFFMLDSLWEKHGQGELGRQQLDWLAQALDQHSAKPAIVLAHHNPRFGGDPEYFKVGLVDSPALWDVLAPRKHVKAYVHGHLHQRGFAVHQGIHILDTPATSYVQVPSHTTGWTTVALRDDGMTTTTHTCDPAHPWNNEKRELNWRM